MYVPACTESNVRCHTSAVPSDSTRVLGCVCVLARMHGNTTLVRLPTQPTQPRLMERLPNLAGCIAGIAGRACCVVVVLNIALSSPANSLLSTLLY